MAKFFVAGTDTDVGKTFVSCSILEAANGRGLRTIGLKPVAAGGELLNGQLCNDDALALRETMSVELPYAQVNPICLTAACSPHIAAAIEHKKITASRIVGFCRGAMMTPNDLCLIEGAGGWRVPISPRETMADVARSLNLPVILVVSMRLGCINHAMLSAESIRRDGLSIAGWVANTVQSTPMMYYEENLLTLKSALDAPFVGELPYTSKGGPRAVCNEISLEVLEL